MNRSDEPLFDSRIADWLEDDPHSAPEQAIEVVLAALPSIKQRHGPRLPWRVRSMNNALRLGLAAAAVIVAASGGLYLLGPWSGATGPGTTTAPSNAAPSSGAPSATPSGPPSPAAQTKAFSSTLYGYTVEHPIPYVPTPATETWPAGAIIGTDSEWVDRFFAMNGFVGIASQPLASGQTAEEWLASYADTASTRACAVPINSWTDKTLRGIEGRRAEFECQGDLAVEMAWVIDGRGWAISGNRAVVDQMLETLTIR